MPVSRWCARPSVAPWARAFLSSKVQFTYAFTYRAPGTGSRAIVVGAFFLFSCFRQLAHSFTRWVLSLAIHSGARLATIRVSNWKEGEELNGAAGAMMPTDASDQKLLEHKHTHTATPCNGWLPTGEKEKPLMLARALFTTSRQQLEQNTAEEWQMRATRLLLLLSAKTVLHTSTCARAR